MLVLSCNVRQEHSQSWYISIPPRGGQLVTCPKQMLFTFAAVANVLRRTLGSIYAEFVASFEIQDLNV